jgi:hypothetical protein
VVPLITTVTTYRFLFPSASFVTGSTGVFRWTRVWLRCIQLDVIVNCKTVGQNKNIKENKEAPDKSWSVTIANQDTYKSDRIVGFVYFRLSDLAAIIFSLKNITNIGFRFFL